MMGRQYVVLFNRVGKKPILYGPMTSDEARDMQAEMCRGSNLVQPTDGRFPARGGRGTVQVIELQDATKRPRTEAALNPGRKMPSGNGTIVTRAAHERA